MEQLPEHAVSRPSPTQVVLVTHTGQRMTVRVAQPDVAVCYRVPGRLDVWFDLRTIDSALRLIYHQRGTA